MLKRRLGHSTALMSLAAGGNSAISLIIFIVLSRILAPEEIGLVAFALIFVEIGKIIVTAGFPQAIVRHPVWDELYASTCFYLNLTFALVIALVVFFIGAPLAATYYDPQAGPILQALSAVFFLEGVKAVHEGKLKRDFAFRVIAVRTVVGSLAGGIIGIYLAINGYGVWALVWQQLINQALVAVMTLASAKWRPHWRFSRTSAGHLLRFSSPLMIAQMIGNISSKIFDLLIGIVIGPAALGFFRVGGRILFILQDIVLKPLEQTALSALSRLNGIEQQARGTLRLIRISAFITFPIFFGAAAVGPEFIVFAFGEKWATSGDLMTIIGVASAPLVLGYQVNAALTASGNSRLMMLMSSSSFLINCALAAASVPFGLFAAAAGFAVRSYITIFVNLYFFKKVFAVGILHMLKTIAPAFAASAMMLASVNILKIFVGQYLPSGVGLILFSGFGALMYATLMLTLFRDEARNVFSEGMDLAPVKIKPVLLGMQRLFRL